MSDAASAATAANPAGRRSGPRRVKYIRPASLSLLGIGRSLSLLWEYRDLLYTLSVHRIKVRYKQSALGAAWALLQPLLLMGIYTLMFSVLTKMPSDGTPYTIFVFTGLLPWTMFSTAITNSANSMVTHATLITKVYFPREILPITYVLASIFDFCIASFVLAAFMWYYHVVPTIMILYAIPALAICVVISTALALLLSALQVQFRDIAIAMPLVLQLWMYLSPVVYALTIVPERFRALYILNPMAGVVETFRRGIQGKAPEPHAFVAAAVIAVVLLPLAYAFFKYREATMADII